MASVDITRPDLNYWTSILDAVPAGLSVHSRDGVLLSANKRLTQIYNRPSESMVGRNCGELFHGENPECPHQLIVKSMGHAEATSILGSTYYRVVLSAVIDYTGAVCGFTRALIEVAPPAVKKELLKLDRAGTLEQMVSGIAHDVGTPLGIISGYSEYLLMRSKSGEPGHKELSTILQQTRRIADSMKQMVDLVRPSTGRVDAIGLKGFVTELLDMMGHHLRKAAVRATVSCTSSPPLLYGDAPKLRRAFFNLVITATTDVGHGGNIELLLGQVPGRHDQASIVLAGQSRSGAATDFRQLSEDMVGTASGDEVTRPGLSLTREILQGFEAEIGAVDMGDRGVGLSVTIPVRTAEAVGFGPAQ